LAWYRGTPVGLEGIFPSFSTLVFFVVDSGEARARRDLAGKASGGVEVPTTNFKMFEHFGPSFKSNFKLRNK